MISKTTNKGMNMARQTSLQNIEKVNVFTIMKKQERMKKDDGLI